MEVVWIVMFSSVFPVLFPVEKQSFKEFDLGLIKNLLNYLFVLQQNE